MRKIDNKIRVSVVDNVMKKVSYFVLFVAMLLLLAGCGRNHESPETVNSDMEQKAYTGGQSR